MMGVIGTQERQERLDYLASIDRLRRIKILSHLHLNEVVVLCEKSYKNGDFHVEFDIASVYQTLKSSLSEDHLAIGYLEGGRILGFGIFMMVPSLINDRHHTVYEVGWDCDPELGSIKKGRIMACILDFMLEYYKGIADTAHISAPRESSSICRYLARKGFEQPENHFIKELS